MSETLHETSAAKPPAVVLMAASAGDGEGGLVIAQDKGTCEHFGMPHSAILTGAVHWVLPLEEIAPALVRVANARSHGTNTSKHHGHE